MNAVPNPQLLAFAHTVKSRLPFVEKRVDTWLKVEEPVADPKGGVVIASNAGLFKVICSNSAPDSALVIWSEKPSLIGSVHVSLADPAAAVHKIDDMLLNCVRTATANPLHAQLARRFGSPRVT